MTNVNNKLTKLDFFLGGGGPQRGRLGKMQTRISFGILFKQRNMYEESTVLEK